MSQTNDQLLTVLLNAVPNEDYLNAENIARKEEQDFGTLTDLRALRDEILVDIASLSKMIDRLDEDVQGILSSRRRDAIIPGHLLFPSIRRDRVPADDHHYDQLYLEDKYLNG